VEGEVNYGGETYRGPWGSGPLVVQPAPEGQRIVWSTHHFTWWPAVLVSMTADGRERARFIHPGWITSMQPLAGGRLVIAGVNNEFDSDVIALLDEQSWPGASPPAVKPQFACRDCPSGRPRRYFVVPRTELNALAGTPRLQAHIHTVDQGVVVRTYQNGSDTRGGELILEFSSDLSPVRARMSDAYWTWHQQMEREHRVNHSADACPERAGITLREWQRGSEWSSRFISSGASARQPPRT
jgi:hypothetical protein